MFLIKAFKYGNISLIIFIKNVEILNTLFFSIRDIEIFNAFFFFIKDMEIFNLWGVDEDSIYARTLIVSSILRNIDTG